MKADIVIVGAGPAGLAAAAKAASLSARVLLLDENDKPGGRVLSHRCDTEQSALWLSQSERLDTLLAAVSRHKDNIKIMHGVTVWGKDPHGALLLSSNDANAPSTVKGDAYILANGALETIVPFPGWTLPGIFTLGGLNSLIRNDVIPGKRIVVAGTGPLLFALLDNLLARGCHIAALIQSVPLQKTLNNIGGVIAGLDKEKAGILYRCVKGIMARRIKHFQSHIVSGAIRQNDHLRVHVSPIDRQWKQKQDKGIKIETDILAVSYGLRPSIDLAHMVGCKIHYDTDLGYWRMLHDPMLETSQPRVFVAGDNSQVCGYAAAEQQGKLAAISAGMSLGLTTLKAVRAEVRDLQQKIDRLRVFGRALDKLAQPGPALWDAITDDCIICRCESVTLADIKQAGSETVCDINDLKRRTRTGMGYCQGRYCGQIVNEMLWHHTEFAGQRQLFSARLPLKPVTFATIAGYKNDDRHI
jgi:bacterioferritin-associated ferredoxin